MWIKMKHYMNVLYFEFKFTIDNLSDKHITITSNSTNAKRYYCCSMQDINKRTCKNIQKER